MYGDRTMNLRAEARKEEGELIMAAAEQKSVEQRARYRGCLLGGACGDALGASVEFMYDPRTIFSKYGPQGIHEIGVNYGKLGGFTDDTQMTLFTAEGVISAVTSFLGQGNPPKTFHAELAVPALHQSYLRWLHTQRTRSSSPLYATVVQESSWLLKQKALHSSRAPGVTCETALMSGQVGTRLNRINNSKGCGGVMRVAPCGLIVASAFPSLSPDEQSHLAFQLGCSAAAITHTHPSGWLSSGFLSALILRILLGHTLEDAIAHVLDLLRLEPNHDETLQKVEQAIILSSEFKNDEGRSRLGVDVSTFKQELALAHIEQIGQGWVGEETLGIALYCCLICRRRSDFETVVSYAVNHGGDSDSTGAVSGNILGTLFGDVSIPQRWRDVIELKDVILEVSDDLVEILDSSKGEDLNSKYPPPILTRDGVTLYTAENP